jgi:hypothetical protein
MSISHPLKRGVIAVSAAFSLMVAAAPSQAGVVGSFDPPFGGTNPDLANVGFRGTFDLNVSAGCYGQSSAYVFTGNGCSITVNSITVNFYNTADNPNDPNGNSSPFVASYTLDASTGTFAVPTEQDYVTGAYFDPTTDRLVGFDTVDSNPFNVYIQQCAAGGSSNCSSNNPIFYNGSMLLYFVSGFEPQDGISVSRFSDPAYLVDCNTSTTETSDGCSRYANENSNGAAVTVTSDPGPLPEPEVIPLTLIGLAALTVNRWRTRQNSTRRHDRVD